MLTKTSQGGWQDMRYSLPLPGNIIRQQGHLFPPAGEIYGGSRHELLFRCALLAKAALEAPWQVRSPRSCAPVSDNSQT